MPEREKERVRKRDTFFLMQFHVRNLVSDIDLERNRGGRAYSIIVFSEDLLMFAAEGVGVGKLEKKLHLYTLPRECFKRPFAAITAE